MRGDGLRIIGGSSAAPQTHCVPDQPLDLLETFGPMSAMHAALEKSGAGMPCGLIARFQRRTSAEVEAAIEIARRKFTVLDRRLAWAGSRCSLAAVGPARRNARVAKVSLAFKSDLDGPSWRYCVAQDGDDAWLMAVWTHAVADGPSMLRFIETVSATLNSLPAPHVHSRPRGPVRRQAMAGWLPRFVFEQHLSYLGSNDVGSHPAGIAWLSIPSGPSASLLAGARAECGSFAAWLAAAACMAFRDQQGVADGRILLNLPILRDDLEKTGGFGFGVGSLLMPVELDRATTLPSVARAISQRLTAMIAQGWDDNFERFLGENPKRHHRFAARRGRGRSAPIVTVSWKGSHWQVGGEDGLRDLACFAASPVAHVSGHIDRNGLSLSVTSSQAAIQREDLLRRVNARLGADTATTLFAFDGSTRKPTVTGRVLA